MTITREEVNAVIKQYIKDVGNPIYINIEDADMYIAKHFKQQGIEEGRKQQRESDAQYIETRCDMYLVADAIRNNTGELK